MEETLSSTNTYTKQQWIAAQAKEHPERVFTSLHHVIDRDWMHEAYRRTRKDGADSTHPALRRSGIGSLQRTLDGTHAVVKFFGSRLKWSRWAAVDLVDGEDAETLVRTLAEHLVRFGGVPLCAVFDRPKTLALKWDERGEVTEWPRTARWRAGVRLRGPGVGLHRAAPPAGA